MIPDNTCIPCITAAAGTGLADAYSSSNVRSSSLRKEVYNPQAFILHAVLLCQAFAHCRKFLTAASRRSLDRVSVPVWLIILSDQLLIVALVGLYPTNQLIRRELLFRQIAFFTKRHIESQQLLLVVILFLKANSHALLTRSPLKISFPYDLHVLSIPLAFILSQDQTLKKKQINVFYFPVFICNLLYFKSRKIIVIQTNRIIFKKIFICQAK